MQNNGKNKEFIGKKKVPLDEETYVITRLDALDSVILSLDKENHRTGYSIVEISPKSDVRPALPG